ncbi:MAG: hypothetical protein ACREMQ_19730 [Longimicrobiales bacterium]
MIVVGVALGEGIVLYARHEPRSLNMLINVLFVFYLNQREVRGLFPRSDPGHAAPNHQKQVEGRARRRDQGATRASRPGAWSRSRPADRPESGPAHFWFWAIALAVGLATVEAAAEGRLLNFLSSVAIVLAVITTLILAWEFWRMLVVGTLGVMVALMIRDNLRELRKTVPVADPGFARN